MLLERNPPLADGVSVGISASADTNLPHSQPPGVNLRRGNVGTPLDNSRARRRESQESAISD